MREKTIPDRAPNGLAWCLSVPAQVVTEYCGLGVCVYHVALQDVAGEFHQVDTDAYRRYLDNLSKQHAWP